MSDVPTTAASPPTRKYVTVVPVRKAGGFDFIAMQKQAEREHWKKLYFKIKVRERLHAGKPAQLDAAKAMLAARGLTEVVEARELERPVEERAEEVVLEGLCEFSRREGYSGIWFPTNNIKAMIKENWSVLGFRMDATPPSKRKPGETSPPADVEADAAAETLAAKLAAEGEAQKATKGGKKGKAAPAKPVGARKALMGSRTKLAEGVFVVSCDPNDPGWVYLGEEPSGIETGVAHTTGPKGPQASIKRNEYVEGAEIEFQLWIAKAVQDTIPDETLVHTMIHAKLHGLGANRSQGKGIFQVIDGFEIDQDASQ